MTDARAGASPVAQPAIIGSRGRFLAVAVALGVLALGSNEPSALYQVYADRFGFAPLTITLVFAVYCIALLPALIAAGPVLDHRGPRALAVAGLVLTAVGSGIFAVAVGTGWLFAARAVQGVAVGASTGALTMCLVAAEPTGDRPRASRVAAMVLCGGAGLGPVLAGATATWLPAPTVLPYLIEVVLALAAVPALLASVTPRAGTAGARWAPVHAQPGTAQTRPIPVRARSLPAETRPAPAETRPGLADARPGPADAHKALKRPAPGLATASALSALTWAVTAVFLALVPSMTGSLLQTDNLAVTGTAAGLLLIAAGAVQPIARRLNATRAVTVGLALLAVGCILALIASATPGLGLLLTAVTVTGAGHGLMFASTLTLAARGTGRRSQGATWAVYYTVTYLGEAIPVIAIGFLSGHVGLIGAVRIFLAASAVAAVGVLLAKTFADRMNPGRPVTGAPLESPGR